MLEIIKFLDGHSGSLTFLITAVYVIATIFICRANIKSAMATREQVVESRRQYEEEHRAYVTYEFTFERRIFYGLRFTNHGKRFANHVKIKLNRDFLESISASKFFDGLNNLKSKEFTLGIGQSYDIYFGAQEFRANVGKKPIAGTISYDDNKNSYTESFSIDFENYATVFSVDSDADILHEDMKKQTAELTKIAKELEKRRQKFSKDGISAE